jgi:hypothetical protein
MVLLVGGMFGAGFQCFCLCMRLVGQAVHVPSNILCIAGQLYDRLKGPECSPKRVWLFCEVGMHNP